MSDEQERCAPDGFQSLKVRVVENRTHGVANRPVNRRHYILLARIRSADGILRGKLARELLDLAGFTSRLQSHPRFRLLDHLVEQAAGCQANWTWRRYSRAFVFSCSHRRTETKLVRDLGKPRR